MTVSQANFTAAFSFGLQALSSLVAPAQVPNGKIAFNLNNLSLTTWNVVYVGEFTIFNTAAPTGLASVLANGGSLTNGTHYYYVVTAVGPNGALNPNGAAATAESVASNETNQIAATPNLTVTLSWTAMTGAQSYNIYRGTTPGGENLLIGNTTSTTFTDTGIAGSAATPPVSSPNFIEFAISSFTDLNGNTQTVAHVLGYILQTTGGNGANCTFRPGTTHGLNWCFVGGAAGGLTIAVPGLEMHSDGVNSAGTAVSAGSADTLRITNTGTAALVATLGIICSSA